MSTLCVQSMQRMPHRHGQHTCFQDKVQLGGEGVRKSRRQKGQDRRDLRFVTTRFSIFPSVKKICFKGDPLTVESNRQFVHASDRPHASAHELLLRDFFGSFAARRRFLSASLRYFANSSSFCFTMASTTGSGFCQRYHVSMRIH